MKTKQNYHTIKELVDLSRADMVRVNAEYQRGEVWNLGQRKKLIDSVMRGYQLPIIYLHYKRKTVGGLTQEAYDIIDGQQRITSLHRFVEGAFPLFTRDDKSAKFPKFLQDEPCPWGGKDFQGLDEEHKSRLLDAEIPVAYIETDNDNEIRDLFVRLQSGFPLNAQEKRDSTPGEFTDFILALGGKPEIIRYPGHPFFRNVMGMKPRSDRGKTRQLAAQIAMLFLERRNNGSAHFVDINKNAIDDYYYANLGFDSESPDCQRLREILNKLSQLLGNWQGPKLQGHSAIHLVLFLDSIWDDYTKGWEATLESAQGKFSATLAEAVKSSKQGEPDETWLRYGFLTRSNSDRGDSIRLRHRYYSQRMFEFLGNLTPKDPKRAFNTLEREIIYWRDGGTCRHNGCGAPVLWDEAEIHHIKPHSEGGETVLENGALVHKQCHPKGTAAVLEFANSISSSDD